MSRDEELMGRALELAPDMIRVKPNELAEAHAKASPEFLDVIRQVQYNVLQFQSGLLHRDAAMRVSTRHELHIRYRPLDRVGVYAPGGRAVYPSSLMMGAVTARVAGPPQSE